MLRIQDLNVYYDAIHALRDVNIEVDEGEIVTLIGANGAGKTSTLRAISGLVPVAGGTITFEDKALNGRPAYQIPYMGISHVPEGRRIFSNLTVLENLQLGAYCRKDKNGIKKDFDMVFDKFPRLKERMKQRGGTLSGGEQQMLAMGRALMARPKILLMDEPSMGIGADYCSGDFQYYQRDQRLRHYDPFGGAECEYGAFHCKPRLCHRDGQHCSGGQGRRPDAGQLREAGLSGRLRAVIFARLK